MKIFKQRQRGMIFVLSGIHFSFTSSFYLFLFIFFNFLSYLYVSIASWYHGLHSSSKWEEVSKTLSRFLIPAQRKFYTVMLNQLYSFSSGKMSDRGKFESPICFFISIFGILCPSFQRRALLKCPCM